MFAGKQAEAAERVRAALVSALVPGEELAGALFATRKSAFSGKTFAIGATAQRLVLVELDRKFERAGAPVSVRATDITRASIDGWGGGVRHLLASSNVLPEIRFDTVDGKYRFTVLGGNTGRALMGEDYVAGLEAVCSFIWSATH
jgi:hypothetical protein